MGKQFYNQGTMNNYQFIMKIAKLKIKNSLQDEKRNKKQNSNF